MTSQFFSRFSGRHSARSLLLGAILVLSSSGLVAQVGGGSTNPATNPERPPDTGASAADKKSSDSPQSTQSSSTDSDKDCGKEEKLGSVDLEFPLTAFPFEPGISGGKVWLYIVKPDDYSPAKDLADVTRIAYHSVATMGIVSFEHAASSPPPVLPSDVSCRCSIVQASGLTIIFEVKEGKSIGYPTGQQGDSEARIELLDAGGNLTTTPSSTALVRQYRAAGGIITYDVTSHNPVSHTTRSGRTVTFPDARVETIYAGSGASRYLRQVRTEAGLLDIVSLATAADASSYSITTYMPGQYGAMASGLYTIPGNARPSRKVTLTSSRTGTAPNYIKTLTATTIEYSYNAASVATSLTTIRQYDFDTTPSVKDWSLTTKKADGTIITKQTRVVEELGGRNDPNKRKITRIFTKAGGAEIFRGSMTQSLTPWGAWVNGDVEEKIAGSTEKLRRVEQYETDSSKPGYKKLTYQRNADGDEFRYAYDSFSRMIRRETPWLDAQQGDVLVDTYSYTPVHPLDIVKPGDERPRTHTQSVGSYILSRTFLAEYIDTANQNRYTHIEEEGSHAGAAFGTQGNKRQTSVYYASADTDPFLRGRLYESIDSDGLRTRYTYQLGTAAPYSVLSPALITTETAPLTASGDPVSGKTRRTTTVTDGQGRQLSNTSAIYIDGTTGYLDYKRSENTYHPEGQALQTLEKDLITTRTRTVDISYWQGPRLLTNTDSLGIVNTYTYDDFGNQATSTRAAVPAQASPLTSGYTYPLQPAVTTTTTGASSTCDLEGTPWNRTNTTTVSSGGLTLTSTSSRDMRRRVISETNDAGGYTTTYTYSDDGTTTTQTLPSGGTVITTNHRDGHLRSITGTAVVPRYYRYKLRLEGGLVTTEYIGSENSPRFTITETDTLGRPSRIITPAYPSGSIITTTFYDGASTRPLRVVTTAAGARSGPVQLYQYDPALKDLVLQATSSRANATTIDLTSPEDRVTGSSSLIEKNGSLLWSVTRKYLYPSSDPAQASTPLQVSTSRTLVAGFTGDQTGRSESTDNLHNATSTQTTTHSLTTFLTIITLTRPGATDVNNSIQHATQNREERLPGATASIRYSTDALGRTTTTTDPRHGTAYPSSVAYVSGSSEMASQTDAAGNTTSYTYVPGITTAGATSPGAGQIATITSPAGTVSRSYTLRGELEKEWGAQTTPVTHGYDAYGQRNTLKTFRYPVGDGAWVASVTWPIPQATTADTTTWIYHEATGLMTAKRYADNSSVGYSYYPDRQLKTRTWARGVTTTYTYTIHQQLEDVTYSDSTAPLHHTYDRLGRPDVITQGIAGPSQLSYDHDYDPATLGLIKETSPIPGHPHHLQRDYDALGRPEHTSVCVSPAGTTILHQLTYAYDPAAGRLLSVQRSTPGLAVHTFTYGYNSSNPALLDTITAPVHTTNYTWEPRRDVLDTISHRAPAPASTLLSQHDYTGSPAYQRTAVARSGIAYASSSSLGWGYDSLGQVIRETRTSTPAQSQAYSFDAIGNRLTGGTTASPTSYTPNQLNQYTQITPNGATALSPTYDLDGNLTADLGLNTTGSAIKYEWDAENRLIAVRNSANALIAEYRYDYQGRRTQKTTTALAPQGVTDHYFVYDGWNLLAVLDSAGTLKTYHAWGIDLSGSIQGAGGVGGLLASYTPGATEATHYPLYDGNGNIVQYLNISGTITAHFDYDAFGKQTTASGADVQSVHFGFSTKFIDSETGLLYYGFRYYSQEFGRFVSRDYIEENGGFNIFQINGNNSVNYIDNLGLKRCKSDRLQFQPDSSAKFSLFGIKLEGSLRVRLEKKVCCCTKNGSVLAEGEKSYILNAGGTAKIKDYPIYRFPIPFTKIGAYFTLNGDFDIGGSITSSECTGVPGAPIEGSGKVTGGIKVILLAVGPVEFSGGGDVSGSLKVKFDCTPGLTKCKLTGQFCADAKVGVVAKAGKLQYNGSKSWQGCTDPVELFSISP